MGIMILYSALPEKQILFPYIRTILYIGEVIPDRALSMITPYRPNLMLK